MYWASSMSIQSPSPYHPEATGAPDVESPDKVCRDPADCPDWWYMAENKPSICQAIFLKCFLSVFSQKTFRKPGGIGSTLVSFHVFSGSPIVVLVIQTDETNSAAKKQNQVCERSPVPFGFSRNIQKQSANIMEFVGYIIRDLAKDIMPLHLFFLVSSPGFKKSIWNGALASVSCVGNLTVTALIAHPDILRNNQQPEI